MASKKHRAQKPSGSEPPRRGKTASAPSSSQTERPHFCFRYADRASKNVWAFLPDQDDAPALFNFICEMAQLTWSEIERQTTGNKKRHRRHHSHPTETIDPDAQKDIQRIHLDEIFGETMFRFRVAGEKRLWGFRSGHVFHVVWWDPGHKVYDP